MSWVLIIHEVQDYATWKQVFDDAAGLRRDAGELEFQVLQADDDANQVVHLSRWTSLAAARAFFESPELEAIRRDAGVRAPAFHYLAEVDRGVL